MTIGRPALSCYYCGGPPPGLALQCGRIVHAAPSTWPECVEFGDTECIHEGLPCGDPVDEARRQYNQGDACPPLREGWARCSACERGEPVDRLIPGVKLFRVQLDLNDSTKWKELDWGGFHPPDDLPEWGEPTVGGVVFHAPRIDRGGKDILICRDRVPCNDRVTALEKVLDWEGPTFRPTVNQGLPKASAVDLVSRVPSDGEGLPKTALMKLWGVGDSKARELIAAHVKAGRLTVEEVPTAAGGAKAKLYRRAE